MIRVVCVLLLLVPRLARAERFAVVIGNNVGRAEDRPLEFAERDAARLADALTSVGRVRPDQLVLVQGGTALAARQALIATNERIRAASAPADMLVVYYSGHSDAEALHLGDSSLPLAEVEGLVRGSAARLRLLIVDACRSGVLTRGKGGRPAPAMRLQISEAGGDGVIVLTASAAGEDAQESSALGGSFFTHHLLSGLLGAADADRDGGVTVTEAYTYAYANTLRDSSATLAGAQHPSYRYDLHGQGEVVLAELRGTGARAELVIPGGLDVLVMRGDAAGAMIAEARTEPGQPGRLSLPPGRLFLRARTARALFEQAVDLRGGQVLALATERMDRIELTRLARKGGTHVPFVAGLGLEATAHTGVSDRHARCAGAGVHASLVYRALSVVPRLDACRERSARAPRTTEVQAALALNVHRELARRWSAYLGPQLGAVYFRQPARDSFAGALAVQAGLDLDLGHHLVLGVRGVAQTYLVALQNPTEPPAAVSAVFTWGGALGLTYYR